MILFGVFFLKVSLTKNQKAAGTARKGDACKQQGGEDPEVGQKQKSEEVFEPITLSNMIKYWVILQVFE